MAPNRAMTSDTLVSEKPTPGPQPTSPTSPTNTDDSGATLNGDAIIEIGEEGHATSRSSSLVSAPVVHDAPSQPQRRPTLIEKIAEPFKSQDPTFVTETKTRTLEDTPNGFPRLAAFQSSQADFSLYRSFSYLHSRVLLDLQDEITCLEKELDEIDWDDFEEDPNRLRSREIDVNKASSEGDTRNRRVILREIKQKLMEYDEVLIKARTLESFQKPSDRNYRSVRRYHHNTKPLMDSEMDSIRSKEDTVCLASGREWSTFDGGVETMVGRFDKALQWFLRTERPPLQKYFRTPEIEAKTTDKFIYLYSSSRINTLVGCLITVIIFILLVVPVTLMYKLSSSTPDGKAIVTPRQMLNSIGVLLVFTLLFSAAISLVTRAARHELFASSAAYCAILGVFISSFAGQGG